MDTLVGLKENVILGHLIPAGTAFGPYMNLRPKHLAPPPELDEEEDLPAPRRELPLPAPAPTPRETVPQAGS